MSDAANAEINRLRAVIEHRKATLASAPAEARDRIAKVIAARESDLQKAYLIAGHSSTAGAAKAPAVEEPTKPTTRGKRGRRAL